MTKPDPALRPLLGQNRLVDGISGSDAFDRPLISSAAVGRATTFPALGFVAGGWTLVCLTFTAQRIATGSELGADLIDALLSIVLFNAAWMAITPPVLASVWATRTRGLASFALVQIGLCTLATVLHISLFWLACAAFGVTVEPNFVTLLEKATPTDVMLYGALVGIALGVDQRRRIRQRTAAATALEASLSDARAAMLRAQLRPHFLFNTLNAISALIHDEPDVAERMVARLGDLLRLSLDDTRGAKVTLAVDLATVEAYLAIESLRLGERLRVVLVIEPETLTATVPDLLLQPLVENAVVHGIAPSTKGGTLRITAARKGPLLIITVADDGVGVEVEHIKEGVGLRSARERVAGHSSFVTRAGMEVYAGTDMGFCVEITLPWQDS